MTGNWFAILALLAWPMVVLYLFSTKPINKAILWTILGAYLLLPAGASIKFAGVPPFDKISIPNLAALGCVFTFGRRPRFWTKIGLAEILLLMLLIGPFITSELNTDSFSIGNVIKPGLGQYEATSEFVAQFLFIIPFFLGRQFLREAVDNLEVLRVLVIAGLIYAVLMLFEIRMSPQLNFWVYGYQNSYITEVRDGGWRPVVFMENGLVAVFFLMTTAVAAAAFWRTHARLTSAAPSVVVGYLFGVLVLCKGLGALIYGAASVLLVRFANPRFQLRIAALLAIFALSYPVLRIADLVPTELMLTTARSISEERAASLKTRFDQEQRLLNHASQRLTFGWGRWGRSRIYDEETGKDISLTDGMWIITLGAFGLCGFIAQFGLISLAIFRAKSAVKFAEAEHETVHLAALVLILAISLIDLLPNASISPWTWLIVGAAMGRSDVLLSSSRRKMLANGPVLAAGPSSTSSSLATIIRSQYPSRSDNIH